MLNVFSELFTVCLWASKNGVSHTAYFGYDEWNAGRRSEVSSSPAEPDTISGTRDRQRRYGGNGITETGRLHVSYR